MKQLSLLILIILVLLGYLRALTSDEIDMISASYHRAIREHTSLHQLTDQDIDTALQRILSHNPAPPQTIESVTPQMECQPRPHIVNQLEIKSKLNRQSSRLRTYHNYYNATVEQNSQISTCILLHRCGKHSGCCRNEHQECSPTPASSQVVTIDVTVQMRNVSFVESMDFTNHTECSCQGPTSVQCICPEPFMSVNSQSGDPCDCQCTPGRESECRQLQSGQSELTWHRAPLPTIFASIRQYQICHEDSVNGRWRETSQFLTGYLFCPLLTCHDGLVYNINTRRCEQHNRASITEATLVTEPRTIRGIKQSDYDQLPPHNVQTTPTFSDLNGMPEQLLPNTTPDTVNKKKVRRGRLKKKLRRKLRNIQEKGLEASKDSSRIAKRLYSQYNKLQRGIDSSDSKRSPGDIFLNLMEKEASVTCTPIRKAKYYYFDLPSHVLFCSMDVA